MPMFHKLTIKDIKKETTDCISVAFDIPDEMKAPFQFAPGQHLTLRQIIDGEDLRRSYSICSSPGEPYLKVAIKRVENGRFSTYANSAFKIGDVVDAMEPSGHFHPKNLGESKQHLVAFVAGSGITPVLSIMKSFLEKQRDGRFTLFYGNRSSKEVIFLEEIEGLKNRYMQRLSVHYLFTREDPGAGIYSGRMTAEKTEQLCHVFLDISQVSNFLICGPSDMIDKVKGSLQEMGVKKDKIVFERFSTDARKDLRAIKKLVEKSSSKCNITLTLDGKTSTFEYNTPELSILDAAQKSGTDLPYACKGGVCCTCRAKVLKGKVNMEVNYGLEAEEIKEGFVLTCQAHPISNEVAISFDE